MTSQARKFLKILRKVQKTEDGSVFINFSSMDVVTVHEANKTYEEVKIADFETSLHSLLAYLQDLGFIRDLGGGYIQVLHAGWHTKQVAFGNCVTFLYKSVLFPIIVSVITAWIVSQLGVD